MERAGHTGATRAMAGVERARRGQWSVRSEDKGSQNRQGLVSHYEDFGCDSEEARAHRAQDGQDLTSVLGKLL